MLDDAIVRVQQRRPRHVGPDNDIAIARRNAVRRYSFCLRDSRGCGLVVALSLYRRRGLPLSGFFSGGGGGSSNSLGFRTGTIGPGNALAFSHDDFTGNLCTQRLYDGFGDVARNA